jgi:hypothetical protein
MLKTAARFVFAGGVMDVRSSVTTQSFWICAAVAVLTSLANSISADSLDTVTVQAQRDRAKLEREVNKFVSSAIGPPNHYDQSLWRWNDKVCPLVAGLNKEQGEFVLARLSEIAKTAGAPLGAETCKPNLYVIVTSDPELLLKQWWRRDIDLSAWDRALLHALYSTSQTSIMQISQMQTAALKDIAPKSPN